MRPHINVGITRSSSSHPIANRGGSSRHTPAIASARPKEVLDELENSNWTFSLAVWAYGGGLAASARLGILTEAISGSRITPVINAARLNNSRRLAKGGNSTPSRRCFEDKSASVARMTSAATSTGSCRPSCSVISLIVVCPSHRRQMAAAVEFRQCAFLRCSSYRTISSDEFSMMRPEVRAFGSFVSADVFL